MNETVKGYISVTIMMSIVGFSFLFVKLALAVTNPLDILAHRFGFAMLAILPVALAKRDSLRLTREQCLILLPLACIHPVITFVLQTFGINYNISLVEVGIIQASSPILVLMLAVILLKEKVTMMQHLFIAISTIGILTIFIVQSNNVSIEHYGGLFIFLGSVISISLFSVLLRKYKEKITSLQVTFFCTITGFTFFSILSFAQHVLNPQLGSAFVALQNIDYVLSIAYLGILSSVVTAFLTSYAFSRIEASRLSVFNGVVVIVNIIAGTLILREPLLEVHIWGSVLILVGVFGVNYFAAANIKPKISMS